MVDKVVLGQVSLSVLPLSQLSIIPPVLLTNHHFNTTEKRTSVWGFKPSNIVICFQIFGNINQKSTFILCAVLERMKLSYYGQGRVYWILWQRIPSVFYDKICIYRSPCDPSTDRKTLQYWKVWCIILWYSQQTGTKHGPTMPHAAGENIWGTSGCRLAALYSMLLVTCDVQTGQNYMIPVSIICTVIHSFIHSFIHFHSVDPYKV